MSLVTDKQFRKARESFRSGDFARADEICVKLLQRIPQHPAANHLLGVLRIRRGDLNSARQYLQAAVALDPANLQALEDLGVAEWSAQEFGRAEAAFRQAVLRGKRDAATFGWCGLALAAQGKHTEAATYFQQAVEADPKSPAFRANLANSLRDQGRLQEAVEHYRAALSLAPANAEALNNLGVALQQLAQLDEAVECYQQALGLEPGHLGARYNLGTALQEQGDFERAVECFKTVLAAAPRHTDALTDCGIALHRLGRFDEAIDCFQRVLVADPGNFEADYNLGTAYKEQGKLREAIRSFERTLERQPGHGKALNNLGLCLYDELDFAASAVQLRRAVAVEPANEWYHYNLGSTLRALGDLENAAACFRTALDLNPENVNALSNLAVVFQDQGRSEDAVAYFRQALALKPTYAEAAMSLGILLLYMARFEEGWHYYEARYDTVPPKAVRRLLPSPRATQADFTSGRRIAVWGEQGLGDRILFSSMIPELIETGAQLVCDSDCRLLAAYQRSFPAVEFVAAEEPLPGPLARADANISAISIAGFLRTKVADFQRQPRGFLIADSAKRDVYRDKLAAAGRLSVAISWKSTHGARGRLLQVRKSASIDVVTPLALVPGVQLVDVQYGDTEADRAALAEKSGREIVRFQDVDHVNDLEDVLAIIAACDLVITTSNITAHFAGALGKPTWLLFPAAKPPLYYWISALGKRSLWYPSVEIITAPQLSDWVAVFAHAAHRLEQYAVA